MLAYRKYSWLNHTEAVIHQRPTNVVCVEEHINIICFVRNSYRSFKRYAVLWIYENFIFTLDSPACFYAETFRLLHRHDNSLWSSQKQKKPCLNMSDIKILVLETLCDIDALSYTSGTAHSKQSISYFSSRCGFLFIM